jgi:anaphase-promoting complex subunit 2
MFHAIPTYSTYPVQELFVNEYRLMLADKLLTNMDYKTDHERHTLELLKLRFGESSMNAAEVMIKDIDDSVRTNKNIRDVLKHSVVDTVIVSHIFWPKLVSSELKHHPRIQAVLDEYGLVYAEQKNPRKLKWMNPLGCVQLELDAIEEGPDGMPQISTKEFTCEPLLVTLISHFEDRPTWTLEELTNEANVPETVIAKKMSFWEGNNVVTCSKNANGATTYSLASTAGRSATESNAFWADAGAVSAVSTEALTEEEDSLYESYIVVMLTSMKQASVTKVHEMLKLMVSSGSETKYNKTVPQLKAFLQSLCRRDKLECGPDGLYKLINSK